MQHLNLTKTLEMENDIIDLILIGIDDKLETIEDKDGIRISGNININGTVKTVDGNKDFFDSIDIDLFLTHEEIIDKSNLNVSVDDFTYKIENNKLLLNISLKIEGLKDIETTFPTEEDNEFFSKEEIEKEVYIDEDIKVEDERDNLKEEDKRSNIEEIESKEITNKQEDLKETKKSLLKSVFSHKRIKEEVSWKLHCVKEETTYEQIAAKYNISLKELIEINKNEKLEEGKLIFLPLK